MGVVERMRESSGKIMAYGWITGMSLKSYRAITEMRKNKTLSFNNTYRAEKLI